MGSFVHVTSNKEIWAARKAFLLSARFIKSAWFKDRCAGGFENKAASATKRSARLDVGAICSPLAAK